MYTHESCHACGRGITHARESCHTYKRVMSHLWTRHVTRMNESCQTYGRVVLKYERVMSIACQMNERVMSNVWTSHVKDMEELCHRRRPCEQRVLSCMSHVSHMNKLCHTEYFTSAMHIDIHIYQITLHIYMSHTCNGHVSSTYCRTWVMSHVWMRHITLTDSCQWCIFIYMNVYITLRCIDICNHGVASVCRIDKIVGLFCKRAL